jgi:hypothetical protein
MKRTKNMIYNPTTEATELFMYATNCGNLYRQMVTPIINNLRNKAIKGVYDKDRAVDAWYAVATEASNRYYKDFGYKFCVADRFTVAVDMADYYEEEIFYNI